MIRQMTRSLVIRDAQNEPHILRGGEKYAFAKAGKDWAVRLDGRWIRVNLVRIARDSKETT